MGWSRESWPTGISRICNLGTDPTAEHDRLHRGSAMPMESLSFISYSRKDYYFAESLAFHLARFGVHVWLDVRDLEPGKDWERGLEQALDAATTVVLVASRDSMASPHVRSE